MKAPSGCGAEANANARRSCSPSPGWTGLDRLELKPREQPLSGLGLSCCPSAAGRTSFTWNSLTGRGGV